MSNTIAELLKDISFTKLAKQKGMLPFDSTLPEVTTNARHIACVHVANGLVPGRVSAALREAACRNDHQHGRKASVMQKAPEHAPGLFVGRISRA
ncbi:hypothetical protein [uncultured Bradyrhizobium sp.]|jgi:flagellar motor component MotA|uniref:hypothetical protein n=1 Tax=uncultured Bradyrhizobium sp. TaxID=199684 RepID=UPI00345BBB93